MQNKDRIRSFGPNADQSTLFAGEYGSFDEVTSEHPDSLQALVLLPVTGDAKFVHAIVEC